MTRADVSKRGDGGTTTKKKKKDKWWVNPIRRRYRTLSKKEKDKYNITTKY